MFSNRSIKDLSLGNFKHFKFLNSDAHLIERFQSAKIEPSMKSLKVCLSKTKPVFPNQILPRPCHAKNMQTHEQTSKYNTLVK